MMNRKNHINDIILCGSTRTSVTREVGLNRSEKLEGKWNKLCNKVDQKVEKTDLN